ncbi:ATP-binding protein [Kitasatospora sp. NPDC085895]|uniref:ATP-binding protein n=1 Tax=Kitasatospora sp. NPDC085895 TaxID=3155057 RepID=UPI00344BC6CA
MAEPQPTLNLTNTPKPAPRTRGPKNPKATWVPPLDWAAEHGPISGAISAATGAGALALLGAATHMPPGIPLAIGAAGAIGHGIGASVRRRLTGRTMATRAASWLLAGGWTTWAIATGPLSWAAAGTLAALGVGIGAMAADAAIREEAVELERMSAEARDAARKMNGEREAIAREWADRIRRVTGIEVAVFAVEFWKTGAGYSLAAELPGGSATWDRIAGSARALATDARLPLGCTVGVEEGDRQGRVILDIATTNVMAGAYPYPDDYSELSILTGIPWGLLPNSETVQVFLREACALILGPPGSGKSTFIDAVIAGFARCTDVITWTVDLKAGAVGIPWVRPWLEAQGLKAPKPGTEAAPAPAGTRPGVDWVASTPAEALRMFRAVIAINKARQQQYQDLLDANDTTLLPVSAKLPQIMVVVDEGAELLSARSFGDPVMKELQELVGKTMRTTRAMGIRLVLTAVDGNVSALGDTSVRKFSPVGAALTSGESSGNNLAKLFPSARVDTRQLSAKGCGVIGAAGADGFAPTGFKGWKTSPSMVRDVVLATNARRPYLDQISARAAGEDYARRWDADRAGWLWENATGTTQTAAPVGGLNLGSLRDNAPDDSAAGTGLAEVIAFPNARPAGLNLSSLRDQNPAPAPSQPVPAAPAGPDWLAEAIDAIESAGHMGLKVATVAEMVVRDRKTVRAGLQAAADRGELVYRENGPLSVFVHPDHA